MSDRDTETTATMRGGTVASPVTNCNRVEFGRRLESIRGRHSQQAVADLLGISRMSLGRYESGDRLPDVETLLAICQLFGCSQDWLLFGSGPPPVVSVDLPTSGTTTDHEG